MHLRDISFKFILFLADQISSFSSVQSSLLQHIKKQADKDAAAEKVAAEMVKYLHEKAAAEKAGRKHCKKANMDEEDREK